MSQGRYVTELRIGEQSFDDDVMVRDLYPQADKEDVNILGLVRNGRRRPGLSSREVLRPGDFLVVEGEPKSIEAFMGQSKLEFAGSEKHEGGVTAPGLTLAEAIVPDGARIQNRTARSLNLLHRHSVTLLGVARGGERFRDRVRLLTIRSGDVLLACSARRNGSRRQANGWACCRWKDAAPRSSSAARLGCPSAFLPWPSALAVLGLLPLTVALAVAVIAFVALGLVTGREVYASVEWKVIVLLASLIPLAEAFERHGGADLAAAQIVALTDGLPPWIAIAILLVVTMTLSDFLNNVATTLIAAPIAVSIAAATGTNPDTYLMTVAIAASCAFLTPIGHKNNTIILSAGGYRFSDYWRMGLPLEVIVVVIGVPAILFFWPL